MFSMKTVNAIAYYETTAALAAVLEVTSGAISQWGEYVPEWVASRLEKETQGKLKYDHVFYKKLARMEKEARRKKAA